LPVSGSIFGDSTAAVAFPFSRRHTV